MDIASIRLTKQTAFHTSACVLIMMTDLFIICERTFGRMALFMTDDPDSIPTAFVFQLIEELCERNLAEALIAHSRPIRILFPSLVMIDNECIDLGGIQLTDDICTRFVH